MGALLGGPDAGEGGEDGGGPLLGREVDEILVAGATRGVGGDLDGGDEGMALDGSGGGGVAYMYRTRRAKRGVEHGEVT